MKNKQVKFLKQLLETPSATGTEIAGAELVRERLADTADEIEPNVMGSVHARLSGRGAGPGPAASPSGNKKWKEEKHS